MVNEYFHNPMEFVSEYLLPSIALKPDYVLELRDECSNYFKSLILK